MSAAVVHAETLPLCRVVRYRCALCEGWAGTYTPIAGLCTAMVRWCRSGGGRWRGGHHKPRPCVRVRRRCNGGRGQ